MILPSLAAIAGGILFAITESINKNITEKKYSAFAYAFIQHFFLFIIFLIPAIATGHFPPPGTVYLFLAISIGIYFFANVFGIKAYKTEDISNITIISKIDLVINFLLGVAFLAESVTGMKIFGFILILLGVIVILYEGKRISLSQGLLFAMLSGLIFGFRPFFDKLNLHSFDLLTYVALSNLGPALLHFSIPQARRDIPKILSKYKTKIFTSRFFSVAGYLFIYWSIQNGNISIVTTNSGISYLLSLVLFGIIFLRERKNIANKLAGSLLCILGIILLNIF